MKIAICDDSQECLSMIDKSLRNYLFDKNIDDFEIDKFNNPTLFLDRIEKNGGYNIILLDICMPGISGISVAHEIRSRHDKTEIVFVTTSDEFAVEAFVLKAAHYIIKPYTQEEFNEAMDRVITKYKSGETKMLSVKTDGGDIKLIDISEIEYIESVSHSQNIHLRDGLSTECRLSLSKISEELEKLSPGQFVSPFKGYIVNQKAIITIQSKYIYMRSGVNIPIARNTYRSLSEQYFRYMFQGGVH